MNRTQITDASCREVDSSEKIPQPHYYYDKMLGKEMKQFKREDLTAADEDQACACAKKSLGLAFYCDRGDGVILRAQVNIYKNATEPSVSIAGALSPSHHTEGRVAYLGHTSAFRRTVQHIPEDSLEQYATGALSEPEVGPLEEHLLICAACQDRLQATDDYVVAMRAAAKPPVKAAKKKTVGKRTAAASAPAVRGASGQ